MLAAPVALRAPTPYVRREVVLGRSERGRAIVGWEIGEPHSRTSALVVGCIHGNEVAGIAIARALLDVRTPVGTLLWVVPSLNPDGVAARTRDNGRGVDLNRNFPWHWRPLGPPSTTFYSGTRAFSERETRIAAALIRRVRPAISIWFHQHLNVVDASGGDPRVERRFAALVGMHLRRLVRYPGSAVNWENARFPGTTSFLVELPAGRLAARRVRDFVRAIADLVALRATRR